MRRYIYKAISDDVIALAFDNYLCGIQIACRFAGVQFWRFNCSFETNSEALASEIKAFASNYGIQVTLEVTQAQVNALARVEVEEVYSEPFPVTIN
jgi:hypothetical protein